MNVARRARGNCAETQMQVTVEMSGGLELLCGGSQHHQLNIPDMQSITIRELLVRVCNEIVQERQDLFVQEETVRPGVLVLINDVDWELEGGIDATVNDQDQVVFISTLHGG